MVLRTITITEEGALIMGITFKENCPDIRNSGAVGIYHQLVQFGLDVDIYDPWADPNEVQQQYAVRVLPIIPTGNIYDAIVVAVAHGEFVDFDYPKIKRDNGVLFDIKACLDRALVDGRL